MLGLIYVGAAALYLALMFFVVRWAWRTGKAKGSTLKALGLALTAFLLVYLAAFWNQVPTILVYRHYCDNDAGLSVQMGAEQWRATHETEVALVNKLPRNLREATSPTVLLPDGFGRSTYFDGLLASDFKSEQVPVWLVDLRRLTWRTVDARTETVLAMAVDYQTGAEGDLRFWVRNTSCVVHPAVDVGQQAKAMSPLDKLFAYDRNLTGETK